MADQKTFHCPGCDQHVSVGKGCADELGDYCDDCAMSFRDQLQGHYSDDDELAKLVRQISTSMEGNCTLRQKIMVVAATKSQAHFRQMAAGLPAPPPSGTGVRPPQRPSRGHQPAIGQVPGVHMAPPSFPPTPSQWGPGIKEVLPNQPPPGAVGYTQEEIEAERKKMREEGRENDEEYEATSSGGKLKLGTNVSSSKPFQAVLRISLPSDIERRESPLADWLKATAVEKFGARAIRGQPGCETIDEIFFNRKVTAEVDIGPNQLNIINVSGRLVKDDELPPPVTSEELWKVKDDNKIMEIELRFSLSSDLEVVMYVNNTDEGLVGGDLAWCLRDKLTPSKTIPISEDTAHTLLVSRPERECRSNGIEEID